MTAVLRKATGFGTVKTRTMLEKTTKIGEIQDVNYEKI